MIDSFLQDALRDAGVTDFLRRTNDGVLARSIAVRITEDTGQPDPERLPRFAFIYEVGGLAAYRTAINGQPTSNDWAVVRESFSKALVCWQALLSLPEAGIQETIHGHSLSQAGLDLLAKELPDEVCPPELTLAFRVAVSGLLAERPAETRLELHRFSFSKVSPDASWRTQVMSHVLRGVALLCRKSRGWADVSDALDSIGQLRTLQKEHEDRYIDSHEDLADQTTVAYELVGLYHLAQMLTATGDYLKRGQPSLAQVQIALDRHRDRASLSLRTSRSPVLAHLAELLWIGCRELARNSIWSHVASLGERVRDYARSLIEEGHPNPIIELWPSQQEALSMNLMDPYGRAILIEMPTSAGKTLLAKFLIVQTKALNPNGTVAYVVPTRALVNQVTMDLRGDFRALDPPIIVEQAVPAFELNPTEQRLLGDIPPDVLVTTPEKLDLLLRKEHAAVSNIAMVVADEAHNIGSPDRGPRLELLLGMLRRDQENVKFVLLSPFLPNDEELVTWLGGDRALPPIVVNWRPGKKVVGAIRLRGRGNDRAVVLETLPAADNTDMSSGLKIPLTTGDVSEVSNSIRGLTQASVQSFLERGAILVLCRGPGTAVSRAGEISSGLPSIEADGFLDAVKRYLEAEAGTRTSLIECLEHGVAYHHSGLSQETRWLIETLIKQDKVKVVCGTTTLAQGVNFPISTVIVETLQTGPADLTYEDFWNIAGRAGRTLMDTLGVVAFPSPTNAQLEGFRRFLEGEATTIASQLATLVEAADEIAGSFNLEMIGQWPALSSLLQFLAHALHVSGREDVADEVEDILRSSLVYHQAQSRGPEVLDRLVYLCRSYLQSLRGERGVVALSERTGFATPSVLKLLQNTRHDRELSDVQNWNPSRLFGADIDPLTRRIEVIAELPEIRLGAGQHPPFNASRVAAILRDWIRGDTLGDLAARYLISQQTDESRRISEFSRYLYSQLIVRASWGLGALETVSLAGATEDEWQEVGYVPSMAYFGVNQREAVWLRMAGVPRIIANSAAGLWRRTKGADPTSFQEIRSWVNSLGDEDWRQTIPHGSNLTPADLRSLCAELVG